MAEGGWEPIETADKTAERVLVCFGGDASTACWLGWKRNPRIVAAHAAGANPELSEEYWGDIEESDDYELAKFGVSPSHWLPIPSVIA